MPEQPALGAVEAEQDGRPESPLSAEWDELSAEQRADEARAGFHERLQLARDGSSPAELEQAASMLSVLRGEIYATDEGRQEFERLEAEYDVVESMLDGVK